MRSRIEIYCACSTINNMMLHKLKHTLITAILLIPCMAPHQAHALQAAMQKAHAHKPEIKVGLLGAGMATAGWLLTKSDNGKLRRQQPSQITHVQEFMLIAKASIFFIGLKLLHAAWMFWQYRHHSHISRDIIDTWILLTAGADVNEYDEYGNTPLLLAIKDNGENNNDTLIKLLIRHNADVNRANRTGHTPLTLATVRGDSAATKMLIDAHADVHATTYRKLTALTCAIEFGHHQIIALLLKAGATISEEDENLFRNGHRMVTLYTRPEIERQFRFYLAKRELKQQLEHLFERAKIARATQEIIE